MKEFVRGFAFWCSSVLGSPGVLVFNVIGILIYLSTGPYFRFSNLWQIILINVLTVITYLALYPLQISQNHSDAATHTKLDALIQASKASNKFMGLEDVTEDELDKIIEYLQEIRKSEESNGKPRTTKN